MSTHLHINNPAGLEDLDPAATPAQDATHFRKIRAARADLEQAKADLREAVDQARAAGDSWTIIGAALETSCQAAYLRFGRDELRPIKLLQLTFRHSHSLDKLSKFVIDASDLQDRKGLSPSPRCRGARVLV